MRSVLPIATLPLYKSVFMRYFRSRFVYSLLLFLLTALPAVAKVNVAKYGLEINQGNHSVAGLDSFKSLIASHPQIANKHIIYNIEPVRMMNDKTVDFYLLLLACLVLGVIRFIDPRYFHNLWKAFINPTLSARQIKDQMQGSPVPNLLMNMFFTIIAGAYIFYSIRLVTPQRTGNIASPLLVLMIITGLMVIYLGKYAIIRFSGWAFNVEGITEHYIFNIFLINKMLAVILLPFTIILAFADPVIIGPAVIVSSILICLLLINRYTRSWQVFGSFFHYSKFHFFTYLCASELLPLAVLMKLLVRGFLY